MASAGAKEKLYFKDEPFFLRFHAFQNMLFVRNIFLRAVVVVVVVHPKKKSQNTVLLSSLSAAVVSLTATAVVSLTASH